MSDWETRLADLRASVDRRAARVEKLREQGLHELAAREDKATAGERAELASILAQMEQESAPKSPPVCSPACSSCGGSGWHHFCGYPAPCPACNYDGAVPYSC